MLLRILNNIILYIPRAERQHRFIFCGTKKGWYTKAFHPDPFSHFKLNCDMIMRLSRGGGGGTIFCRAFFFLRWNIERFCLQGQGKGRLINFPLYWGEASDPSQSQWRRNALRRQSLGGGGGRHCLWSMAPPPPTSFVCSKCSGATGQSFVWPSKPISGLSHPDRPTPLLQISWIRSWYYLNDSQKFT